MGSGCSASGASMPAFGLLALLALVRRRRVTV
jgi:MYXO-CTERM domain-containing protein